MGVTAAKTPQTLYESITEGYTEHVDGTHFLFSDETAAFPGFTKNLWWIQTADHCEDWFVVGGFPDDAIGFFADYEGYDVEEEVIWAVWVSAVPCPQDDVEIVPGEDIELPDPCWATDEDLLAAGGECLGAESPRQWRFGAQTFVEGGLEAVISSLRDDVFEARGDGRPNGTIKSEEA